MTIPGRPGELDEDEWAQIRRYEDFTTIDWIEDAMIERNRRVRYESRARSDPSSRHGPINARWVYDRARNAVNAAQSWVIISIAGVFIGVNAALISIITEWLSDLKMGYCSDGWWLNQQVCCWEIDGAEEGACSTWRTWSPLAPGRWLIYVLFAMVFSFVAAHLVRSFAKYAAGSGISEIKCILAGFVMQGYLGGWTLIIKSITLPFVIASGLSVGKEGPSVHVACCIGNVVARMFSNFSRSQGKMREILTAASAAGVAVAFGSPIGGVLFSIEEMSHNFSIKTMWRSFLCALVATVTLSVMNPFRTGKLVLFQVTYDRDWHFFEIIFFMIIGAFGGLYGALVIRLHMQVMAFRRKYLANQGVTEAVVLATLTAFFGYFNRFLRIDMTESLAILFRECEDGGDYDNLCQTSAQWRMVNSLFLATTLRILFVVVSYGCKVPAGIFVPSMAIGATFGRMVGIIVKATYRAFPEFGWFAVCQPDVPCITPGTYAFLGAAAALGGVMRITVTVVVIMFELTGALTYILPTMIVLLMTRAVGDLFGTSGIADEMIRFNGYPYLDKEEHGFNIPVSRVMRKEVYSLDGTGMTVHALEQKIRTEQVSGYPIVSRGPGSTLLGYIGRNELNYVLDKARQTQDLTPDMECSFVELQEDVEFTPHLPPTSASPAMGIEDHDAVELIETVTSDNVLKLWPWVNRAPLTVAPQLPLEIVMQIFKRLGPRIILVEQYGKLQGLVTVKDVLRFTTLENSRARPWDEQDVGGLIDEAWVWISEQMDRSIRWAKGLLRR
ncbi:Cl-channel protein [Sistotremastrum niveocremeum HHB9708]|uniref:Chloride channel protein n=1 Tax=Sistotremastrum niveocremeum HHB9708 TaxID=1314777 RepID=A0A165A4N9_9AGAM|nr:Cl-channel protein [Sistotremastrum niveocremeum HHB9708]